MHAGDRAVSSISSVDRELLRDPDADVTSPGLPAVDAGAVHLDAANESDAHDAVGLDMARLIEVRSSAAPSTPSAVVTSPADDAAAVAAFRSRKPRLVVVMVVLCVVAAAVGVTAALSLLQSCGG